MALVSCARAPVSPSITPTPSATLFVVPTFAVPPTPFVPTITPLTLLTRTPAPPTVAPSPTPSITRDPSLTARGWKTWPVLPAMTGHAFEIYRAGLAQGSDPHAFSRVADCQGIQQVFLGVYDLPGSYKLSPENAGLQATIDWFRGSFKRDGMATLGGFNARSVLQPEFADPATCQAGESPIECEYRVHRPSIVLVALEFGYDGRTTANYAAYMRKVIEFYIGKGVLPVLATKADNFEGDDSINMATASLALEYDLPLWNWWRAAQDLPNHGMDATRPDGFHISVDAWQVRSALALQTLDRVWRAVQPLEEAAKNAALTPQPTATRTATVTVTPTLSPLTPTLSLEGSGSLTPTLDPRGVSLATSGHALLSLATRQGAGYAYQGVFVLNLQAPGKPEGPDLLQPLLGAGWNLQAVAPDGKAFLANLGSDLFVFHLDGRPAEHMTDGFLPSGRQGASWAPDDQSILFAGNIDGVDSLYLYMPGDQVSTLRRLGEGASPLELYPSPDLERAYFLSGACRSPVGQPPSALDCLADRTWTVPYATPILTDLPGVLRPAFSSDGASLAYTFRNELNASVLAVTTLDRSRIWSPLPPDAYTLDYAWSPSGRWLAALSLQRSDYSGKPGVLQPTLLNPATLNKVQLPPMTGISPRLAWSADGRSLLVFSTDPIAGTPPGSATSRGYRLVARLFDVQTGMATELDGKIGISGADYTFVTNVFWLP